MSATLPELLFKKDAAFFDKLTENFDLGGYVTPAQEAGMKISAFLTEEVQNLAGSPPVDFHHYTSGEAMLSIVGNGNLRAGSLNLMNDPVEIRYAASIFRACLDRRISIVNDRETELLRAMQSRMKQPLATTNVFSTSFGIDGDREEMWGLYADRGRGFSFSVPAKFTPKVLRFSGSMIVLQCQYGEDLLSSLSVSLLVKAQQILDQILADRADYNFDHDINPAQDGVSVEEFAAEYLNEIALFAAAFKPKVWQDEQEWRWTFVSPPEEAAPFLELNLSSVDPRLAISAVMAGPSCNATSVQKVRAALDARGMTDCPIHQSASARR